MPAVLRLLCPALLLTAAVVGVLQVPATPAPTPRPSAPALAAVATPATTVTPTPKRAVQPTVAHKRAHHQPAVRAAVKPRVRRTEPLHRRSSTAQQRLDRAIARIPGYPAGGARWVLEAKDGFWGTADWYRGTIYISPRIPANRLYDVVLHEWAHLLTVRVYSGDVELAKLSTNRYFGGTRLQGAEKAADCIARQLGGRWTHYTSCANSGWRAGAVRLVAGKPV